MERRSLAVSGAPSGGGRPPVPDTDVRLDWHGGGKRASRRVTCHDPTHLRFTIIAGTAARHPRSHRESG